MDIFGILAGGAATRSAIDANSIRFLYGGSIMPPLPLPPPGDVVPDPAVLLAAAVPGMAGDARDMSTGGVCEEAFRDRSAAADPSGELAASGTTLETAKSTAEKLYLELPPVPPPAPPSEGLSRLADLVGVRRAPGDGTSDAPVADGAEPAP